MTSARSTRVAKGVQYLLSSFAALLLAAAAAPAQTETGQISGTVLDPQGAAVVGVKLTAKSIATGTVRTTATTSSGDYAIVSLQPGLYEVTAEAPGFAVATLKAQVIVGSPTALDVALVVRPPGESVDVVAAEGGVQVNTETPVLSTTFSQKQIQELPTLTRYVYDLVGLTGNVSCTAGATTSTAPSGYEAIGLLVNVAPADPTGRGVGVAINGQRFASTNILLDGASNNDEFTATPGQIVPLESVQEFTVLTNSYSAEFGRASGGIVNLATRTGSNEFHGTVYEFNRVSALASQDFRLNARYPPEGESAIKKGVFTRNQFGFSVGGPVVKDRLVYFVNTEWIRVRSVATVSDFVATPELVAASDAATQAYFANFLLATPINGRVVRVGDIPGLAKGPFTDLRPNFPAFGEVFVDTPADTGAGSPQNSLQLVDRVDWNASGKTTVYVRHALERTEYLKSRFALYAGLEAGALHFNNNVLASVTHVFSPRFVAQSKFAFSRLSFAAESGGVPIGPQLSLLQPGRPFYLGKGVSAGHEVLLPGYDQGAVEGPQNVVQFYEDANDSLGNHQLRFGGSYVRILDSRTASGLTLAYEWLGLTPSQALDNFVLGHIVAFRGVFDTQGHYPSETVRLPLGPASAARDNRYNEFALYMSDSYRARPRLTFTLGLRFEYYGVQHDKDRKLDSNFYYGEGATIFERIRNGRASRATESPIGRLYNPDWNNFGPRVGVAWDVTGDGRTSLRAGYGVSYERNFGNVTFNALMNPPNFAWIQGNTASFGVDFLPIYIDDVGPFAGEGTKKLPPAALRHIDEDIRAAYAHQWSVSLQRELFADSVASIEYSGSKGVGLYSIADMNRGYSGAVYLGLPAAGQPGWDRDNPIARLNRQYTVTNTRGNGGFSHYNGVTFGFESRDLGRSGLDLTAKYTWSHAVDNLSSTFSESTNASYNLGFLDPFDPKLDEGDADYDMRHRFASSGVWEIPFARYTDGWKRRLLDGWTLTYIYTARTGTPFTIYDCTHGIWACMRMLQVAPIDANGQGAARSVGENQYVYIDLANQQAGAGTYVNPVATAAATSATGRFTPISDFGPYPSNMTRRNAFRGPGAWDVTVGVSKTLTFGERSSLQFRAEVFNPFNHPNLYVDTGRTDIADHIISAYFGGRRQVQLAVKCFF